jgi:uncharacterized OsmC-like protein
VTEGYRVEVVSLDGGPTGLGWGYGGFSVVVDRPKEAGGRGLGFSGGQLLNLAVAGCVSNDLVREATKRGIRLNRIRVTADSDYTGDPLVSTPITYTVEVTGDADREALDALVEHVDAIAEIPNSLRRGTEVTLRR